MMEADVFAVDVDELSHAVDRMAACGSALHELAADLERRIASLHISWQGEAATAHRDAQAECEHGFRTIREALATMQNAARVAHGNYTAAVEANLQQWGQVR
jgi:WXG100 family type VII secretion target